MTRATKTSQTTAAQNPQATALRFFFTLTFALGALLTVALASQPAAAATIQQGHGAHAYSVEAPAHKGAVYFKGNRGANKKIHKGFKPTYRAKGYRSFGHHGFNSFGTSRFGNFKGHSFGRRGFGGGRHFKRRF